MARSSWKPLYNYLLNKLPKKKYIQIDGLKYKGFRKTTILPKHVGYSFPTNLVKGHFVYRSFINKYMIGYKFGDLILTKRIMKPKIKKKEKKKKKINGAYN